MNTNHDNVNVDTATPATADQASNPDHASQAPAVAADAGTGEGATGDASSLLDLAKAASQAEPGTPAGDAAAAALTSAVEAATNAPVDPDKVATSTPRPAADKPVKAKGESNKQYNKRVAAWRATQGATPDPDKAAHKAAIDKANVSTGKPDNGLPAQGGKPASTAVAVSAAKAAKPLSVRQAVLASTDKTKPGGFDLTNWPKWCTVTPSHEAIMAARAFGVFGAVTKNIFSVAMAIEQGNPLTQGEYNVYDYAACYVHVPPFTHTMPDHKCNASLRCAELGLITLIRGAAPNKNPASTVAGGKARVVYRARLTARGLKLVEAYFQANGLKVPRWLSDPHAVEAEMQAAADKAAKAAAREAKKSNVPA